MKTIFVTLLAFTLLLLSCIKDEKEDVINYIEENDKLPEFTVKSPTGEELHSDDLSGNTTLLVFFVTTCGDCKRELPKIDSVWNEMKDHPPSDSSPSPAGKQPKSSTLSGKNKTLPCRSILTRTKKSFPFLPIAPFPVSISSTGKTS